MIFIWVANNSFFNEPRRREGHKVREEKRREGEDFIKDVDFILATAGGNSKPIEATKMDDSKICFSLPRLRFAIAKFAT